MLDPSILLTICLIVNGLNPINLRFRHFIGRHNDEVNVTCRIEITDCERTEQIHANQRVAKNFLESLCVTLKYTIKLWILG